jgi:Transglycosylase-like domain
LREQEARCRLETKANGARSRAPKDVIMRTTTTAALATAGAALALPAPAFARSHTTDERAILRAPVNAKAQMHAARRMHRTEARIRARRRPPRTPAYLAAIAACESGGNPATNTGNGFYGKYQFDLQTWASVGGSGLPSNAGEAEQDRRAATLYARAGATPWPVCGQ